MLSWVTPICLQVRSHSHDPPSESCNTGSSTRNKRGQCISKIPQTVWGKYKKYYSVDENDDEDDDDEDDVDDDDDEEDDEDEGGEEG